MKIVNADDLKKEISKAPVWTALAVKEMVDEMTKTQVRCEECKWRGEEIESGNPYHWCRLVGVGYEVDDTHFCSYGEREGE